MFAMRMWWLSVFQQNPLWGPTLNLRLLFAIPFMLGIMFLFCYIDWFNHVCIPFAFFFSTIPFTIIIIVLDEICKLAMRTYLNRL
ncbi:hypothetical protein GGH92_009074, partial [Coemansia sp. RSA 2673]